MACRAHAGLGRLFLFDRRRQRQVSTRDDGLRRRRAVSRCRRERTPLFRAAGLPDIDDQQRISVVRACFWLFAGTVSRIVGLAGFGEAAGSGCSSLAALVVMRRDLAANRRHVVGYHAAVELLRQRQNLRLLVPVSANGRDDQTYPEDEQPADHP